MFRRSFNLPMFLGVALAALGCTEEADDPVDAALPDAVADAVPPMSDCRENPMSVEVAACEGVDIHDPGACTPARAGLGCDGIAQCADDVFEPGAIIRCCDGERWTTTYTDPEVCGLPDQGVVPDVGVPGDCREVDVSPIEAGDDARCRGVDIFDASACTDARAGLACDGRAMCENDFEDPGTVVRCCVGDRWVTTYEDPEVCGFPDFGMDEPDGGPVDAGVDGGEAPSDMGVDGGPFSASCDGMGADPRAHLSSAEICGALDTTDPDDCTAAQQYVVCSQTVECDNGFFDPGAVIRCCDGEEWVWLDEDPDLCGTPPPE